MKPISLTKTMPWLLGASAVFTLAFSQNVFANTNGNPQATSIKQVNKTNANQANTNNLNLRMGYLNISAKLARGAKTGDWNVPLPTSDGLDNYHNQINAKLGETGGSESTDYRITYALGDPKPFNTSIDDGNEYALFSRSHWENSAEASQIIKNYGYRPASDYQNNPQVDLGNGVKAYKEARKSSSGFFYNYYIVFYQGPYQIKVSCLMGYDDNPNNNEIWDKTIDYAKQDVAILKSANLPQTDGHGIISINHDKSYFNKNQATADSDWQTTDITWQKGNKTYNSTVFTPRETTFKINNPFKTNLKMTDSIK